MVFRNAGIYGAPDQYPVWLSRNDLDYYVEEYQRSGFRGPINWYRNIPTNNDLTPELANKRFIQPAAFIAGSNDAGLQFDAVWREHLNGAFDDLRFIEIIDGAGHWLQMEKPTETTALILRFLSRL